jgi:polar amino acid transport system substrate-binding protein
MRRLLNDHIRHLGTLVVLMIVAIATMAPSASADPDGVLDRIRSAGVLKIPVMVGEEPGYVKDPQTGEWGGFYVEWGQEIADLLGVGLEPVETTWGNLAADFQAGKIDIAFGLNPNPKRGFVVDYLTIPLFTDAWALVTTQDFDKSSWKELNDPSVRLVVQKGSTMQVVAEALAPNATLTVVEERPLGVLEMKAGRADAMLLAIFDAIKVQPEVEGKIILPEPMLRNPAFLAVKREDGNEGYINWLTNWTQQQRALGLAQAKLRDHFEKAGIDLSALPPEFSF